MSLHSMTLELPTTRHEKWKYTDTRALNKTTWHIIEDIRPMLPAVQSLLQAFIQNNQLGDIEYLVFIHGNFCQEISHFSQNNINIAQNNINIKNTQQKKQLLIFYFGDAQKNIINKIDNIIHIEKNAEINICEVIIGENLHQENTEWHIAENAILHRTLFAINQAKLLKVNRIFQAKNSQYQQILLEKNALWARQETLVYLNDTNAHAELLDGYLPKPRDFHDHHLTVYHNAPHTTSHIQSRGLVQGKAVFNGLVHVAEGADKTDSNMHSKALLLDARAELNAKPELEIYADDVKCAHGSSIGQIDPNHIFYLRSRGIEEAMAQQLLLGSFLSPITDAIPEVWKTIVHIFELK